MKFKFKYFGSGLLLLLLVLIRFYEKRFFNDGLIDFFQHDYLTRDLPHLSLWQIIVTDSLRYWLQSVISIGILYLYFSRKELIEFLSFVYVLVYITAVAVLVYLLNNYESGQYIALFYVRRVLIQPVLLFIMFPALLYQQKRK